MSFFGNKRKDTNHPLPPHCPEKVHSNPCLPKLSVSPTPLSPNRCLEYSLLGTCFQSNSVPWLALFPLLKIPFILLSIYLNPSQLHFFLPGGAFLSPCHLQLLVWIRVAVRGHGRENKRAQESQPCLRETHVGKGVAQGAYPAELMKSGTEDRRGEPCTPRSQSVTPTVHCLERHTYQSKGRRKARE